MFIRRNSNEVEDYLGFGQKIDFIQEQVEYMKIDGSVLNYYYVLKNNGYKRCV